MKLKDFYRRILCVLLTGFLLIAGLRTLAQNAHGSFNPAITAISNYENYLKITEQLDLPHYYVLYEHIQVLGDYQYYAGPQQLLQDGGWLLHKYYAEYGITDKNDQLVTLYMMQKNLMAPKENHLLTPLFTADMQALNTEKSGTVIRGPLRYIYESGKLAMIRWRLGDVDFFLSIPQDYPMDAEETVCSRLLSKNYLTALSAYHDLIRNIPKQPGEPVFTRILPNLCFAASVILLLAFPVVVYVLSKRCKKRRKPAIQTPQQK